MSWFKVDDKLHGHRKTRAVRRSGPASRDVAPFGLWVLAGSWCGDNGTRGFVPVEILEDWDDNWESLAGRLVAAGLWIEAVQDGEPGFQFHDWDEQNPPDAAASGSLGNHIRWHVKKGVVNPDCADCHAIETDDSSGRVAPDDRPRIAPESQSDIAPESLTRPDPTRPDPTRPDKRTAHAVRRDVARFDEFWRLYPRKQSKGQAERAWTSAVKTAPPDVILAGLRAQLPSLAMNRRTDGDYRPHPATWLNGKRWEDDQGSSPVDPLWKGAGL